MANVVAQIQTITVDGEQIAYVPDSLSYQPFVVSSSQIMDTSNNLGVNKYNINDLTAEDTTTISFQIVRTEENARRFEEWRRLTNNNEYVVINVYFGEDINSGISYTIENCRLQSGVSDVFKNIIDVTFLGNEVKGV